MKTRRRPSVMWRALICTLSLLFTVAAYSQSPSIDQLRQQILKLTEIATDPAMDAEIKKINQRFLDNRRKQLSSLLREKLAALQSYQNKVSDVLAAQEKQALAKSVIDIQNEITALETANHSAAESDVVLASPPTSPSLASGAPAANIQPLALGDGASTSTNSIPSTASVSAATSPQPRLDDFNTWLNARIESRVKAVSQARIDQRSNVNQIETPAIADNSSSLVDQSSASDLIGVGLNLAGLTTGTNNDKDKNSAAVTATAYSLYSMFRGEQPLDPSFYNKHRDWRRLSFTLGFEKDQKDAQGQPIEEATIAGAKYLIVAGRDAAKHRDQLNTVYEYLKAAAVNFAQLNREIRNALLFGDPSLRNKLRISEEVRAFVQQQLSSGSLTAARVNQFQDLLAEPVESWFDPAKTDFAHLAVRDFVQNKYFAPSGFPLLKRALDDDALKEIDQMIDARLDAFTGLNNASRRAIEQIRKAPQFSLAVQAKLRKQDADEYKGLAIFEYGLHDRVNLTLNGSYLYRNSRLIGADTRRAQFAGQLQFQMTPEKSLAGRSPLYFFLASEGDWGSGIDSIFKAQGKVKIPIIEGIDFPISLTYANRTELIKEGDVRGQFGFTFDTAKLLRAFLSKR